MGRFYTIQESDVNRVLITFLGRQWQCSQFIGRIMKQDVGKRCYLRDGILQVENEEQFRSRLLREK